ncbi:MAG: PilZ domain-containing protein, partial [Candidatus Omnitrophota bacterium]|nr:PilZ domain-containing protein [Candidatus Omnitrophota bacterium]
TPIELLLPGDKKEPAETIDISEGGLCFISAAKIKPDSRIRVKMGLADQDRPLSLAGRIARVKDREEFSGGKANGYKTGLEFIDLTREQRAVIRRTIYCERKESKQ